MSLFLIVVLVLVVIGAFVGLLELMTRSRTSSLTTQIQSLQLENADLRRDEGPKVQELRELVGEHDQLLDKAIALGSTPLNELDLTTRQQSLTEYLATHRPRQQRQRELPQ
jgi:hypothetical protein